MAVSRSSSAMRASSSAGSARAGSWSRTRSSTWAASPAWATAPAPSSGLSRSAAGARGLQQHVEVTQPVALARRGRPLRGVADRRPRPPRRGRRSSARRACSPAAPLSRPRARGGPRRAPCQAVAISARSRRPAPRRPRHRAGRAAPRGVRGAAPRAGDHLDQRLADALEIVAGAAAAVEQGARSPLPTDATGHHDAVGVLGCELGGSSGRSTSENVASTYASARPGRPALRRRGRPAAGRPPRRGSSCPRPSRP